MPGLTLRPILPKKPPVQVSATALQAGLRAFSLDMVRQMQTYPPIMPWKHGFPKKGLRRGGNRTGVLAKNWSYDLKPGEAIVANRVPYAGYVEGYRGRGDKGEKQTAAMTARGWGSISDEAKMVWARHVPGLKLVLAGRKK